VLRQWRELLGEDVGDACRVLRELLKGPLRFTPIVDGSGAAIASRGPSPWAACWQER
jgi:hypothetical protein